MMRSLLVFLLFAALGPVSAYAQASIPWETLAQVKLVKEDGAFVPRFETAIQDLQGQQITLKGFMLPLDQATEQQHFILSANPVQNCFFCMPGGPESLVEIKADQPVPFSYDPVEISGTLELLTNDPMGMYYRLAGASVKQ